MYSSTNSLIYGEMQHHWHVIQEFAMSKITKMRPAFKWNATLFFFSSIYKVMNSILSIINNIFLQTWLMSVP